MVVLILKGLPASGKSTYAKELIDKNLNYKRVNKDDLRAMLDNSKWSKSNEKFVLEIRNKIILQAIEEGKNIIVDDTNLAPKHEEEIRELVKGKAEVEVKFFDIELEEAIKRDLKRPVSVGEKVIRNMYNQYLKPQNEKYKPDIFKNTAYIFDVDGTLAIMSNRSPFDWDKVINDKPNLPVVELVRDLKSKHKIIIFSGRDSVCKEETMTWLSMWGISWDYIDMRTEGDTRKDSIVKKEMFDKVKNNYNILGVFDDRNQVVEMWRSLGLTCFQVAEGNF